MVRCSVGTSSVSRSTDTARYTQTNWPSTRTRRLRRRSGLLSTHPAEIVVVGADVGGFLRVEELLDAAADEFVGLAAQDVASAGLTSASRPFVSLIADADGGADEHLANQASLRFRRRSVSPVARCSACLTSSCWSNSQSRSSAV